MQFGRFAIQTMFATLVGMSLTVGAFAHDGDFDPKSAGPENETPKELEGIGISEHLGDQVDLNLTFRDETGKLVPLSSFFSDHKPVILSLAYFNCPSLCNFHLNGMNDAFKQMKDPVGRNFRFVVVSIEPKETPELAAKKREAYVKDYGRPDTESGWHFLTGDEAQIKALAKQVGFNYRWNEKEQQYAHASAAYVLTPEGKISRYLYGIVFDPKFVSLSAVEASNGTIGTIVDKVTLWCFHLDSGTGKLTLAATRVMRAGGALMVLIMISFLAPFWLRNRRNRGSQPGMSSQGEA